MKKDGRYKLGVPKCYHAKKPQIATTYFEMLVSPEDGDVSLASGSLGALVFFLEEDLRKPSFSSSAAVALLSGSGSKQLMRKPFASSDIHSGTLG